MLAVFALLISAASTAVPAISMPRPELLVVVRTEGAVSVGPRMMAEVMAGVRDIWRPYAGITFEATERGDPTDHTELQLVITNRTMRSGDAGSLGWIEFVNGRPAQTITVSITAARDLMEASRWAGVPFTRFPPIVREKFLVRALSLSIAHEIGHYLLKSREHAARGLMRGRLTADDIMGTRRETVRIERVDVKRLERALSEKLALTTKEAKVSSPLESSP
jgi:hypothetical protein